MESLIGVVLAVLGIYFLTDPKGAGLNKGDFFTLLCAFCFAFQILFMEMLVKENESALLTLIMVAVTAILAWVASLLFETQQFHFTFQMAGSLLFVAFFCTTIGFQIQARWQPRTSATAAAVIFTMEPVFAALFAFLILNEHLGALAWIGAALIVAGMILTEFRK